MKHIEYKKTYCMNVILSVLLSFGCLIFLFANIDYVEARPSEKILNILSWITPILTMITLHKSSLQKVSLIFNVLVLVILGLFTIRAAYRYPEYSIIVMLIWMVPFVINVKILRELNLK